MRLPKPSSPLFLILLSPLLLNLICERAVGPAPPQTPPPQTPPRAACFGPPGEVLVSVFVDPVDPPSVPVRRVRWTVNVTCECTPDVYSFGTEQTADGRFDLFPTPAAWPGSPDLVFAPAAEPFSYRISGPVHGFWCVSASVDFSDGTTVNVAPHFINEYRVPPLDVALIVTRRRGANIVAPASGNPRPCLRSRNCR